MNDRRSLSDAVSGETHFEPAGTLTRPGPFGRLVRLLLGLVLLFGLLPGLIQSIPSLPDAATIPANPFFWLIVAITLVSMNHVVNLGLGKSWGHRPQVAFLLLAAIALMIDVVAYGRLWAPPLAGLFIFWLILVNLPLGFAFVLAALIGTPGCEMRSYHHLASRITGRDPTEHFCPGGIDLVDKWEAGLREKENR